MANMLPDPAMPWEPEMYQIRPMVWNGEIIVTAKTPQTPRRTRKMLVVLPLMFLRHILVLLALITLVGCETGCQPQSDAWVPNTSQGHPFLANDFGTPTPRPIH